MSYNSTLSININNFDGPIDVLLELVRQKQMDIFDINLLELATAYVKLIETLKYENIDLASEYLVMAATLIQIKTKMLIEIPENNEEFEEEKQNILNQLIERYKYKNILNTLREKEEKRSKIFIKNASDYNFFQKTIDEKNIDGKSNIISLIIILRKMFERNNFNFMRNTILETINISPAERRIEILALFKKNSVLHFNDVFAVQSINHFSITMLTILDMASKGELEIEQQFQYGDIKIIKGELYE